MSEPLRLPVQLYGTLLGHLSGRVDGSVFEWDDAGAQAFGRGSRVLSDSMRVGRPLSPDAADNFFGGLLPEGIWLSQLAREVGVAERDVTGLLNYVGRDLAGAMTVGVVPLAEEPEPLNAASIRSLLERAGGYVIGGGGSALPGFQRKIALSRLHDHWYAGNGSVPSTHILKPAPAEFVDTLHRENYTLSLARELSLSPFASWIDDFAGQAALVIERYDRRTIGAEVERIHQEDLAQAMSLSWRTDAKFEQNDPNANLLNVALLLDTDRPALSPREPDRHRLLRYVTFNVAVGNTDAHAKNFSILHPRDDRATLSPLYDVAPIACTYEGRQHLAMKIAGEGYQPDITKEHILSEAESWGIPVDVALPIVEATLSGLVEATREVLVHPSIAAQIPGYIREQSLNLLGGRPAYSAGALPPSLRSNIGTPPPGDPRR
jgi:serine/threonine-protein kinase HipA